MVSAMHEWDSGEGVATLDLPEWSRLLRLARQAERRTSMAGLASFLLAKAKQVSDGVPTAMHGGKQGRDTFAVHRSDHAFQAYFSANPWWPDHSEDDPLEQRWSLLGGWFGLPPALALSTADATARRHDPASVFIPPFAVAYAADLVYRLARHGQPPTWSEVWDRWGAQLPAIGYPPSRRFDSLPDSLRRAARRGASPEIPTQLVTVDEYPGFEPLVRALRAGELKLVHG